MMRAYDDVRHGVTHGKHNVCGLAVADEHRGRGGDLRSELGGGSHLPLLHNIMILEWLCPGSMPCSAL
jgi:hypothetical protein